MDELDMRIVRELTWIPANPLHVARGILKPWDVARKLGLHGNTVKGRLDELSERGVLHGMRLAPALGGLGLSAAVYRFRFESPAEKAEALDRIRESDSVLDIRDFIGEEAWVGVLGHEPHVLDGQARLLADATGAREFSLCYRRDPPRVSRRLSPLDLRVLAGLLDDALRPVSALADEIGVSVKTARARFNALADAHAFSIVPHLFPARTRGFLPFTIGVRFAPDAGADAGARFLNAFPGAAFGEVHRPVGYAYMGADDFASVEDHLVRAQAVEGVAEARILFPREIYTNTTALRRVLATRIERLASARAAPVLTVAP